MTAEIATRYAAEIAVHQELLAHVASTRGPTNPDPRWPVDDNPVEGPSLLDPGLKVHLRHSYQDAGDLGSFPAGSNPVAVRIHVQAFAATCPDRAAAGSDLLDAVTEVESEAWTRAMLGEWWADHAYELVRDLHPSERERDSFSFKQRIYVVLGQDGEPTLAPDNFTFRRLWPGIGSARKLEAQSAPLAAHIERVGPFFETEGVRDPNTDADGGWRVEFTGLDPADLAVTAGEAARRLMRRVRMRGVIDTKFRTTRVHIENDTARVYFLWAKNPNMFALSLRLPQSVDDLPGPPADSPVSLVSEAFANWQENLRTGMLFWGTRTRMDDGALHVSWPKGGPSRDGDGYGIAAVPQHDRSGVWLADAGLNIDKAVAAKESGHLAAWLQAYVNNVSGRPFVAHAAARWDDDTTAVVDVLESVPNTPTSVLTKLVHALTHALANSGARVIELHYVDDAFAAFGYIEPPDSEGTMYLDVTAMP